MFQLIEKNIYILDLKSLYLEVFSQWLLSIFAVSIRYFIESEQFI